MDGFVVTAGQASGYGGGIWVRGQDVHISRCTFTANDAGNDGAGLYFTTDSTARVSRCLITNNSAGGLGGGLVVRYGADVTVRDSLFRANHAGANGGGVYIEHSDSSLELINATMVANTAGAQGSAVYNNATTVTIANSIIWNNTLLTISPDTDATTVSYSDVQGGHVGDGVIDSPPQFVDPANGNYSLQSSSPCVDAANGDVASPTDLKDSPRHDAPKANTGIGVPSFVDMGALEYHP
jgi:hypothetical protein